MMEQLLRLLLAFTVAYLACVFAPREVFAQGVAPGGRTIYALPTPAGVIPTEVLGTYSPLPQTTAPSVSTANGVAATSSAQVPVKAGGKTVTVPVTATVQVPRAALARAAAKLLPVVGTALAAKELADLLLPLGYSLTSSGQLQTMERPAVIGDVPGTGYRYQYAPTFHFTGKTPQEACGKTAARYGQDNPAFFVNYTLVHYVDSRTSCVLNWVERVCRGPCFEQPLALPVDRISNFYVPELGPADAATVASDAASALANQPERQARLFDALQKDWQANPNLPADANPISADTPIQVNAPPVTTPEQIVKTETRQLPDGSTDTIVTREKTVVTPTTSGNTVGDAKTSYTYNTTTTTSTTNNISNVTTTSVVNQSGETPSPEKPQDPCEPGSDKLSCKELGAPPEAEDIPKIEVPFSFNPLSFASAAGCPSPVAFQAYGPRQISFQPLCDVMTQLRPIFLACAALATALIFLKGIRSL